MIAYDRRFIPSTRYKMAKKPEYSFKIAMVKTLKNVAVMFGLPAVLYVLSNVSELVPPEYLPVVIPIASAVSYMVKNYIENK